VIDGVGVGVGVTVAALTTILIPPQGFDAVGVGVGVGVTELVGVTVGVGVIPQSKYASKLISQKAVGVGVGVIHGPEPKKSSHKSGQELKQGDLPNKRQVPSRAVDKHQLGVVEPEL
jgi:hypothetical protein